MLAGLGIDIARVERFKNGYERWGERFLERLFHVEERRRPLSLERWAGRFAAKEAVMKSLGMGLGSLSWHDIRILRTGSGQPQVTLHGRALGESRRRGIGHIHLSLSHERDHVVAVAVAMSHAPVEEDQRCES